MQAAPWLGEKDPPSSFPGVVVIQEVFGPNESARRVVHGFAALAVYLLAGRGRIPGMAHDRTSG